MKPDCKPIRPLLSAYFDGETTPAEASTVREHLATCADCQTVLEDYRRIRYQFNRMSHPAAPPELRRAVLAEVHAVRSGRPTRRAIANPLARFGPVLAGLALLITAVILALVLLRPANDPNQTFTVAQVVPIDDGARLTFSQPVDPESVQKNVQLKDSSGQQVTPIVTRVDDRTVEVKLPASDNNAGPIVVDINNKVTDKKGTPVANPTSYIVPQTTKAGSTNTPRPPQQTTVPANPSLPGVTSPPSTTAPAVTTPGQTTRPPATTPPVTTPAATTPSGTTAPPVTTTVGSTPIITTTTTVTATVTVTATTAPPVTTTIGTTPTVTTLATVTPTVTATASATATVVGANCRIKPAGSFATVYATQSSVPAKIGCPTEAERSPVALAYQPFAGGFMLYDSFTNRIYVFYNTGRVENYPNTFSAADPTPTPVSNPQCASQPVRGFGKLWFSNAVVRQGIGCPSAAESSNGQAALQNFEKGLMFAYPAASNGSRVYVVFNDGTYLNVAG